MLISCPIYRHSVLELLKQIYSSISELSAGLLCLIITGTRRSEAAMCYAISGSCCSLAKSRHRFEGSLYRCIRKVWTEGALRPETLFSTTARPSSCCQRLNFECVSESSSICKRIYWENRGDLDQPSRLHLVTQASKKLDLENLTLRIDLRS